MRRTGIFSRVFALMLVIAMLTGLIVACSEDDDDDSDGAGSAERSMVDDSDAVEEGASEPSSGGDAAFGAQPENAAQTNGGAFDRLVIRTATVSLAVEDVQGAASAVRAVADRRGGYVLTSSSYVTEDGQFAEVSIRVPSDEFDAAMDELMRHDLVVRVDREETSSRDVTQEYVDNESRLNALETTEQRFLELLSEAETIDEILRIESELNQIRTEIETIKGRQQYLDEMIAFSTITVSLYPPDSEPDEEDESFFARVFDDAWNAAEDVLAVLLTVAIFFGLIALAISPVLIIAFFVARWIVRRRSRTPTAETSGESAS